MSMKFWLAIGATALVAASRASAATTLAAGPNYGGYIVTSGGTITCRLFNAGVGMATVSVRQIYDNIGNLVTLSGDNCALLYNQQSCEFRAPISGNLAFSCRAVWSGTETTVRGVSEVQDAQHNVLNSFPMQ